MYLLSVEITQLTPWWVCGCIVANFQRQTIISSIELTGHWLKARLSSKPHEGRSASILCMWGGTWGGWSCCDKSAVLYISCQSLWGHSGKTPVDMMCSYANAIPGDESPFCFVFFPTQHIISPHIFWACITSLLIFAHVCRASPPVLICVAVAAGVSVYDSTCQYRPSAFGSSHGVQMLVSP